MKGSGRGPGGRGSFERTLCAQRTAAATRAKLRATSIVGKAMRAMGGVSNYNLEGAMGTVLTIRFPALKNGHDEPYPDRSSVLLSPDCEVLAASGA